MLSLIRYLLIFSFLMLAIYFGGKGLFGGITNLQNRQTQKKRSIYYAVATFCGFVSFELYEPNAVSLVCFPVLLISIWIQYLLAISFLPSD